MQIARFSQPLATEMLRCHNILRCNIAKFFRSSKPPIAAEETIELYAFMQAAAKSKQQGGTPVNMAEVMQEANQAADKLLGNELK